MTVGETGKLSCNLHQQLPCTPHSTFSLFPFISSHVLFCMSSCIFYNFIYISTIIATFMYIGEMGKLSCKLDFLFSKVSYILLNLEKKMIFFISTQEKYPTLFIHFFYIISAQKTLNWLQHRMIFL